MKCASKFSNAMHTAANIHFSKRHQKPNRYYLTEETWRLIEQRQQARTRQDHDMEKTLNAEIRKQAKADKTAWKIQQLETLTDTKQAWKEIRATKHNYFPNFYNIKDIRDNRVPMTQKVHAIAEYLFEKQWGPKYSPPPHRRVKTSNLQRKREI